MVYHHYHQASHIQVLGPRISDYSRHLVKEIAREAQVRVVYVTSVQRTVEDQARIFYNKHIVEGKPAKYRNPAVTGIIAHAREMRKNGENEDTVRAYMIGAIEHVHGGPQSISRHIGLHPFLEVFDVAHYSGPTIGLGRKNAMTDVQAAAFLEACRTRMGNVISRLGHSGELGFKVAGEFHDEKCFHMEVRQPIFDRLEDVSGVRVA